MAKNSPSEKLLYEEITELLRQAEEYHRLNSFRARDSTTSLENIALVGENHPRPKSITQVIKENYSKEEFEEVVHEAKRYFTMRQTSATKPSKLDCYFHAIKNVFSQEEFNLILEEAKKLDELSTSESKSIPNPTLIKDSISSSSKTITPNSEVVSYCSPLEVYAGIRSDAQLLSQVHKTPPRLDNFIDSPLTYDIAPFFKRHWKGLATIGAGVIAAALLIHGCDKLPEKYNQVQINKIQPEKVHYKD
jgi:hypothetical protein